MERNLISVNLMNIVSIGIIALFGWGLLILIAQAWLYLRGGATQALAA